MNKNGLWSYILDNFNVEVGVPRTLLLNILEWVSLQSMDREDTLKTLLCLLDGLGITEKEVEMFLEGGSRYGE